MRISAEEQEAIKVVIAAGEAFGFGNMVSHLNTAWARALMQKKNFPESLARASTASRGYPFKMQDDLIERGEWDETGAKYRQAAT